MSDFPISRDTPFEHLSVKRLLIPSAFVALVAYQALSVLPLIVGALIDHRGFTASEAGMVGSIEILAMAGVAILMAPVINRLRRDYWAVGAAICLAMMQLLSALPFWQEWFYLERFIAGLSSGVLVAVLAGTIPLAHNPERLTALIILVDSSATMLLYILLPYLITQYGLVGAYGFLSFMTLVLAPLFFLIPAAGPAPTPLSSAMRSDGGRVAFYSVMLSIGATALWSFTERMGISIGIDLATIGQIFAGSILVGLVGASSAALIGQKLGSFWPVIVSSSIAVLAAVSMPQVNSAVAFIVIFCILQLSQQFSDPFKVGVIARLDTEGRLMGLTAGTGLLGAAFGPFLAGVIVEDGGFHRLSYLYLGLAALSYAAFWPLLRRDQAR